MASTLEMKTTTLKLWIDSQANKVVFAEADKAFVDFICDILSLPMNTIIEILDKYNKCSTLGNAYKSIQALSDKYMDSSNKDLLFPSSSRRLHSTDGYVKEAVTYMVMDNLEVKPLSMSLIKFHIKDGISSLIEKNVRVGSDEGLAILKASLETQTVLTAAFLQNNLNATTTSEIAGDHFQCLGDRNSVFFSARKIDDPTGLLPGRVILGIDKRGVHIFRPTPKEYLHSVELRDIMRFGCSYTAVFFVMRVAGVLHDFQFETKQGEEICVALQTHINDEM